jgi:hypothetical protein
MKEHVGVMTKKVLEDVEEHETMKDSSQILHKLDYESAIRQRSQMPVMKR